MVRFLVLYRQPTDLEAFEKHYFEVHVPLVQQLPGLRRYTLSRHPSRVRGADPYHFVAELDWDDLASLQDDFASPLGQEAAHDVETLESLCPGIHSMMFELQDL